jgi:hypothetical protein
VLGFFSFTEITDPAGHQAYNEWHQLDHLPEQFSLDGMLFGQRWVCTPECQQARVAVSPRLEPCHYVTLYLMRDADVLPSFFALGQHLHDVDRFFEARESHLSGAFALRERWVAPRVLVSEVVVPFRPSQGIYVVVGPPVDGAAMVACAGVAGAWAFVDGEEGRHITVGFIDGDLAAVAEELGRLYLADAAIAPKLEWAGPFERIDPGTWDWFDRLTPKW